MADEDDREKQRRDGYKVMDIMLAATARDWLHTTAHWRGQCARLGIGYDEMLAAYRADAYARYRAWALARGEEPFDVDDDPVDDESVDYYRVEQYLLRTYPGRYEPVPEIES
jgi:hypothetical protein